MNQARYSNYFKIIFLVLDVLIITLAFTYFLCYDNNQNIEKQIVYKLLYAHYKAYVILLISWFFISLHSKYYSNYRYAKNFEIFRRNIVQVFWFAVFVFAVSGIKKEDLFSSKNSLSFILSVFALTLIYRLIGVFVIKRYREFGYNFRNAIIIGNNANTNNLIELIDSRKDFGLVIKHCFEASQQNLNPIKEYLINQPIHIVYIALGELTEEQIKEITTIAENNYTTVYFIPNNFFSIQQSLTVEYLDTFPVLKLKEYPLDKSINQFIKRTFDLAFLFFATIFVFSWLFPILMTLIVIDSGFPIFFVQKRNGVNGNVFGCYKFRTMCPNKESNTKPTAKGDKRITRVGAILRKTSLDELAQFINVLTGDMSIVGPRPHMLSENIHYQEIINQYSLRHYVKPGITGLAQMRGYRGVINETKDMELRVKSDIFYIKKWSFLLDIYIIIRTILNVLKGDKNAF